MIKKAILHFLLHSFCALFCLQLSAQSPNYEWAGTNYSAPNYAGGGFWNVESDNTGNSYYCGTFTDTCDLDPGPGVMNYFSPNNGFSFYIMKLDPLMQIVWIRVFYNSNFNSVWPCNISINDNNEIGIIGVFEGTYDFNPQGGVYNLTSGNKRSVFVLKLDNQGNFQWVKSFGNENYTNHVDYHGIKFDNSGNLIFTTYYRDLFDCNPGPNISYLPTTNSENLAIVKLDPNGSFIWGKGIIGSGGAPKVVGFGLDINMDNAVYSCGGFESQVDFDPSNSTYLLNSQGNMDGYILKLDSNGSFVEALTLSGLGLDYVTSVACSGNRVYSSGVFKDSAIIKNGANVTSSLTSSLNQGNTIFKTNSDLNPIWKIVVDYTPRSIFSTIDKLYTTGQFYGYDTLDFDHGPSNQKHLPLGQYGAYISCIDSSSTFNFASIIDGNWWDVSYDISVDKCNNIFTSGATGSDTIDFDPGTNQDVRHFPMPSSGSFCAGYIHKMNLIDTLEITLTACDSVTIPSIDSTFYSSTTFVLPDIDITGCDSITRFDLHIYKKDTTRFYLISCDSVFWSESNQYYLNSGQYYITLVSNSGCDSVLQLNAKIAEVDTTVLSRIECEEYYWDLSSQIYTESGIYDITLLNQNGCDSTVRLDLKIVYQNDIGSDTVCIHQGTVYIPNAFSPNGDGKNDYFEIFGIPEPYSLLVLDRWGKIVFSSKNYENNWDGTYESKQLPLGSYTYLIEYKYVNSKSTHINSNGSTRQLRGIVTLIP
jgi:gliding motility-associated-like protein